MSDSDGIKVLVTGASGYIAAHVTQQLLYEGYLVRGTVRSLGNAEKVDPLRAINDQAGGNRLELVEAELLNQDCWADVVRGCTYVCHTASPFSLTPSGEEEKLVKPAVEGTLNVLRACAGQVKRVVLTSSVAAIGGHHTGDQKLSEKDWPVENKPVPNPIYSKSKRLAERAAWDYLATLDETQKFELAVLNPAMVLGPPLTQQRGASIDLVTRLMSGKDPMVPRFSISIIDVRDVARAHVIALTLPEAAGNRHILTSELLWFGEMIAIMVEEFGPQGYNLTTREMPLVLAKILSFFDSTMKSIRDVWGATCHYDNTRMREVLHIQPRSVKESIIEMVYTLIENGKIPKTSQYCGRPPSASES